jgi:hypothetical protein
MDTPTSMISYHENLSTAKKSLKQYNRYAGDSLLAFLLYSRFRSPCDIGGSQQHLSKRDFNGYIRFRIILSYIAIFGTKFTHNVPNSTTVCNWCASCRDFLATYRDFQRLICLEVLIPVGIRAIIRHQIQSVAFMHKPDWPGDISTRFSTFNAKGYLVCTIQPLMKIGFGHDILCWVYQIWVSHVFASLYTSDFYYYWKRTLYS